MGPGIAPEFLPHVFEQFRQADSSVTREHGGLGLGLAIAQHIVECHQGTIVAGNRRRLAAQCSRCNCLARLRSRLHRKHRARGFIRQQVDEAGRGNRLQRNLLHETSSSPISAPAMPGRVGGPIRAHRRATPSMVRHRALRLAGGSPTGRRVRQAATLRSGKLAVAIPRAVFRPRVSEIPRHHRRFEPCDGWRDEAAARRRGRDRSRATVSFPAAAPAAAGRGPARELSRAS